jgi:hypothetical protein
MSLGRFGWTCIEHILGSEQRVRHELMNREIGCYMVVSCDHIDDEKRQLKNL